MDRSTRVTKHECKELSAVNAEMLRHTRVALFESGYWLVQICREKECILEQAIDYCPFCGKKLGEGK